VIFNSSTERTNFYLGNFLFPACPLEQVETTTACRLPSVCKNRRNIRQRLRNDGLENNQSISLCISLLLYITFLGLMFRNFSQIKRCGDNNHKQALALNNLGCYVGVFGWNSNRNQINLISLFCKNLQRVGCFCHALEIKEMFQQNARWSNLIGL